MTQEQRAAARSMISKGELGRTPEQQRDDFNVLFADLPLGDDVTLTVVRGGDTMTLDATLDSDEGTPSS